MGLDYLNKKVWHTGSMKNIQKVWEAEQAQHEIYRKRKQRAKKLREQQHNEELKRIQVEAGLIPRSHLDRMQWMYDWGNKIQQQEKNNEQFLIGKKQANNQLKPVFQQAVTNRNCEDYTLLHQDPLYEIQKQEKLRRQSLMNNPIEMKNIIREVQTSYLPKKSQKSSKKHKRSSQNHYKSKRSSSSQSNRSRSRNNHKKSQSDQKSSSSYKQSKMYKQYLKQRFSGILKKDQQGNYKPDYNIHKTKYRTEMQMNEDQRRKRVEEMRENFRKLNQIKGNSKHEQSFIEKKSKDYETGISDIRKNMLKNVGSNRNFKKYKNSDFE